MTRFIFAFTVILAGASTGSFARPAPVRGNVVASASGDPLPGALVEASGTADPDSFLSAVADSAGRFVFRSVSPGTYDLVITLPGFEPDSLGFTVEGLKPVDLGTFRLEQYAAVPEYVVVVGRAPTYANGLQKQIYSVGEDVFSSSSSATEVLQNIPSVSVDIDNTVSLRNSADIGILIDGKSSALLRRNPKAVLDQMPADTISRIEIITNPSAKYRPDGGGGIINIILKENEGAGFTGLVGIDVGNEDRRNADLAANRTTDKFNLAAGYHYRTADGEVLFTDERIYRNPDLGITTGGQNETGNSRVDVQSHAVSCAAGFRPDEENAIELTGEYFVANSLHVGRSTIATVDPSTPAGPAAMEHRINDEQEEEWELGLAYERTFQEPEGRSLVAELGYSGYDESEDLDSQWTFGERTGTADNLIRKCGDQVSFLAEFVSPAGDDSEVEAGYSGSFLREDIRYDSGSYLSSRFRFQQDVHALYAVFGGVRGAFGLKSGLRLEEARITSHLKSPADSLNSYRYLKLFPSLHVSREFNSDQELSISYSKRLNRPDSDELNPYPEYSDPRNAEAGNPLLEPEQVHSLEMRHQMAVGATVLTNAVYYRHEYDAFTSIQTTSGDSLVITRPANLDTEDAWGFESSASGSPTGWWDLGITGDLFHTTIDAASIGYSRNRSTLSGNIKAHSRLRLGADTAVQLNAFYYFQSITPQGRRKPFFYLNAGLKHQLFDQRATVSLTVTDLFESYRIEQIVDSPELSQNTSIRRRVPVFYLGFTWRLDGTHEDRQFFEGEGLRK